MNIRDSHTSSGASSIYKSAHQSESHTPASFILTTDTPDPLEVTYDLTCGIDVQSDNNIPDLQNTKCIGTQEHIGSSFKQHSMASNANERTFPFENENRSFDCLRPSPANNNRDPIEGESSFCLEKRNYESSNNSNTAEQYFSKFSNLYKSRPEIENENSFFSQQSPSTRQKFLDSDELDRISLLSDRIEQKYSILRSNTPYPAYSYGRNSSLRSKSFSELDFTDTQTTTTIDTIKEDNPNGCIDDYRARASWDEEDIPYYKELESSQSKNFFNNSTNQSSYSKFTNPCLKAADEFVTKIGPNKVAILSIVITLLCITLFIVRHLDKSKCTRISIKQKVFIMFANVAAALNICILVCALIANGSSTALGSLLFSKKTIIVSFILVNSAFIIDTLPRAWIKTIRLISLTANINIY